MNDEARPAHTRALSRLHWTKCLLVATSVEILLRTLTLPKVCRLLGIGFSRGTPALHVDAAPHVNTSELAPSILRVARRVDELYRRFPLPDTCLRRALVAGRLLAHHRPELVLGVRRAPRFEAHAWLAVAGGILDWSERHAEFTRL